MWVIGLIVGLIVGAVGGGGGVVIGALVGGLAGWLFSEARKTANQRHVRLETSVSLLSDRVRALEERFAQANKPASVSASEYQERPAREPISESPDPSLVPRSDTIDSSVSSRQIDEAPSAGEFDLVTEPEPQPFRAESLARAIPTTPTQFAALKKFLLGGNTVVRVGVIVLFFGVSFLLKFASEHIEIPIEARLIGVAIGALVMLAIGWRLRLSRPDYGLILQGGAIGVLYLTVFVTFRLYQLLPGGLVLALLAAMAIFSAMCWR